MQALRHRISSLIMEFLEDNSKTYSDTLVSDIRYLNDFKLEKEHSDNINDYWVFCFYTFSKDYKIVCVIKHNKSNNLWSLRSEAFWKELDKKKSPGAGMEYTIDIEEINGYESFVSEVNRKLHNSPISNTQNYHDDYDFMMTKEIIRELIRLIIDYPKIEGLSNSQYYNDLKQIYNDTVDLTVEETIDYINKNYPGTSDKQQVIYKLNTLDSLDNFLAVDKMSVTPEDETFQ